MKLRSFFQRVLLLPASIPPNGAWILVFAPALTYFLSTRFSAGFFGNELGDPVTHQVSVMHVFRACHALTRIFEPAVPNQPCAVVTAPTQDTTAASSSSDVFQLKFPLQLVLSSGLEGVVDAIWRHDPDLERGYLLLSESKGRGRLWRWEVGGGPIAIGKTLHLEDAGCRSAKCTTIPSSVASSSDPSRDESSTTTIDTMESSGSGALAIDFYQHGSPSEVSHLAGALTVAEWGEGRIVRLEENGARTPLVMHIPCPASCHSSPKDDTTRAACTLPRLQQMAFTARGDLILAVNYQFDNDRSANTATPFQCTSTSIVGTTTPFDGVRSAAILRLEHAVHIPALASLPESRRAHEWTAVHHNHSVSILYTSPELVQLGGMAMESAQTVCASAIVQGDDGTQRVALIELPTAGTEDKDDDDEVDDEEEERRFKEGNVESKAKTKREPTVLLDLSAYTRRAGALAVSAGGTFFMAAEESVLIANRREGVVGRLNLGGHDETPTAVVVGGDGYLYIASASKLFRIRTKEKPVQVSTNEVVRAPSSLLKT